MTTNGKEEPRRLRVAVAERPGGVLVTLSGHLDAGTFDLLENAVDRALAAGACRMIVDMSGLTYIGSAGAGVLLAATSRARSLGGEVALLKPSPPVADVFALLGMSRFCRFADTMEKAEEILRSPSS